MSIQSTPSHGCSFFCQGSKKRTEKIDDFPSLLLLCTIYSAQKREKNSAIIAKIMEEFFLTKGCLWTKTFFGCFLFVIFFSDFWAHCMYFQKDASGCKQTQRVYGNLTHDARGQLSCHCTTALLDTPNQLIWPLLKGLIGQGIFCPWKKSHLFFFRLVAAPKNRKPWNCT